MKPASFEYSAPDSIEAVLALLEENGFDAKILAGGQSLVPTMNFRLAFPSVLIDINRIPELSFIEMDDSQKIRIGATTRHSVLERSETIAQLAPLLSATMPHIAHPQIRNRGTIGGSLVHADPAAELPAVMLALDAKFKLQSQSGERWVDAKDFFVELFMTAAEPEELLTEIEIPQITPNTGYAFKEVARRHGDFALAGVAATVTLDENKKCSHAKVVLLGVGNTPMEGFEAAKILQGNSFSEKLIAEAAEATSATDIEPTGDMHATPEFRTHLAKILVKQALVEAFGKVKS